MCGQQVTAACQVDPLYVHMRCFLVSVASCHQPSREYFAAAERPRSLTQRRARRLPTQNTWPASQQQLARLFTNLPPTKARSALAVMIGDTMRATINERMTSIPTDGTVCNATGKTVDLLVLGSMCAPPKKQCGRMWSVPCSEAACKSYSTPKHPSGG